MTERDNRSGEQRKMSNLEKAGMVTGLTLATTLLAGCTKEGEQSPGLDEANDVNTRVEESQEASSVDEEIRVTQEAFTGSDVEAVELKSTQSLNLGVEKTQTIIEGIEERGLSSEDTVLKGFYKVNEEGDTELVLLVSTCSVEDEDDKRLFMVSGRDKGELVPIELSNQVELLEMTEFEVEEDGKRGYAIEMDGGDFLPIIEEINGVWYYTDFYVDSDSGTGVMTRMDDELSSEVLAVLSSMPEGAQELIDRLGEGTEVVDGNLVYNGTVIGELDSEKQVSFQVEEETVSISTEDLEVKDGVLVSINRERTEEMGVDWIEQVWIEGERMVVQEPQILLPESREDTLIVKEQVLDYFMPKHLAAVKKHLDENGWGGNDFYPTFTNFVANTMFPFSSREISFFNLEQGRSSSYDMFASSWFRVEMEDGRMIDVLGLPFRQNISEFGVSKGESYVWHFAFDSEAMVRSEELRLSVKSSISETQKAILLDMRNMENIFTYFKEGRSFLRIEVLVNNDNIEGVDSWRLKYVEDRIEMGGWENMVELMERIEQRVEGYSDILGREMQAFGSGSDEQPDPPADFGERLEMELIPCGDIIFTN